jgi:hypothetical protein
MARYNEEAKVLATLIKDKNRLKAQISGGVEEAQIIKSESPVVNVFVSPYIVSVRDMTGQIDMVWYNPDYGVWYTDSYGDPPIFASTLDVTYVWNQDNLFIDNYDTDTFRDTIYSDDVHDSSNFRLEMDSTQTYTSKSVYLDETVSENISSVRVTWDANGVDPEDLTVSVSPDAGANWTEVPSSGELVELGAASGDVFPGTFPMELGSETSGQDLRYKIVNDGAGTNYINSIKIRYEVE